jgi:hypothetical protein
MAATTSERRRRAALLKTVARTRARAKEEGEEVCKLTVSALTSSGRLGVVGVGRIDENGDGDRGWGTRRWRRCGVAPVEWIPVDDVAPDGGPTEHAHAARGGLGARQR